MGNLEKHIENVCSTCGVPAVVAINRFGYDSDAEIELVRQRALARRRDGRRGQRGVGARRRRRRGPGPRGDRRGRARPNTFDFLYNRTRRRSATRSTPIATRMYGADGVDIRPEAQRQIDQYTEWGLGNLPVCIAKTKYSLSADANKRSADRLPRQRARGAPGRRRRLPHRLPGRDPDHARPADRARGDARRHRRRTATSWGFLGGEAPRPNCAGHWSDGETSDLTTLTTPRNVS